MTRWWMVRAGDNNELIPIWLNQGIASIGWSQFGNPKDFADKESLIQKANDIFNEKNPRTRSNWVNQVWRFSHKIHKGDRVITYSKEKREYLIGTVTEAHFFDKTIGNPAYPNHIRVKWEDKRIDRDLLPQGAKNSLGSTLTVFRVDDWGETFDRILNDPNATLDLIEVDDSENEDETIIDIEGIAKGMIEEKIDNLDPWEMQSLTAGFLRAMGYYTEESDPGPDGGVDVLAYKDPLGFQKPIIKTQVKHRKSKATSSEIQQLLGAHPMGTDCLFVSTGGFTSNALNVANQYSVKVVDLDQLVEIVMEWYDKLPAETKVLVPLKRIYVPE